MIVNEEEKLVAVLRMDATQRALSSLFDYPKKNAHRFAHLTRIYSTLVTEALEHKNVEGTVDALRSIVDATTQWIISSHIQVTIPLLTPPLYDADVVADDAIDALTRDLADDAIDMLTRDLADLARALNQANKAEIASCVCVIRERACQWLAHPLFHKWVQS